MPSSDQGVDDKHFLIEPRTLIFLFDTQDQVLLLKGAAKKRIWRGKYNGLGGHVEAGEDILESALRELAEETGVKDVPLRFCGQIMVTVSQNRGVGLFIFKAQVKEIVLQNSDEGELEWVALKDISAIPLVDDLYELLPRVVAHQDGDSLILGKYTYNEQDDRVISLR